MTSKEIVCLIPAHNESGSIGRTLTSALAQTRPFDRIIVLSNGSTDATVSIARTYAVDNPSIEVLDLPKLTYKKCEALNYGYNNFCQNAHLVVTIDADTELEPEAAHKWEKEFSTDPLLGGSQAKFTMRGKKLLTRLQKAEYALGIDRSLRRGSTCILAGASSAYRKRALDRVIELGSREGPYSYDSAVEDFELTYQLRKLKWRTIVSPNIRAWTDSMPTLKHLKSQRKKWLAGTIEDLMRFGFNKYTWENWMQQIVALFMTFITVGWISLFAITMLRGGSVSLWSWWMLIPGISGLANLKNANRIPDRDWLDLAIAGSLMVGEIYGLIRLKWLVTCWVEVLWSKYITRKPKDYWEAQGITEGIYDVQKVSI